MVVAPDLHSSSPSSDTIVINWNPVNNAVLYSLDLIMEGSDTRVRRNTSETNMTFSDLQPGTTYYIKGNAWDPDGNQGDDITISQITRKDSFIVFLSRRVHQHITVQMCASTMQDNGSDWISSQIVPP